MRQVNHLFRKALFGKDEDGITDNTSLRHAGLCQSRGRRGAFRIAQRALRDTDDAHDVVQVAMLRLAQSYGSCPVAEWFCAAPADTRDSLRPD